MHVPRSFSFSLAATIVGVCLLALSGCTSDADQVATEAESETAFQLENEHSVAGSDPEWTGSEPVWPEPGPTLTEPASERPQSPTPLAGPTTAAPEPGPTAIRMLPGSAPPSGDPSSSGFSPQAAPGGAEEEWAHTAPAPPIIGPAMVAPRKMPWAHIGRINRTRTSCHACRYRVGGLSCCARVC